ncbi:MAG: hypothetical protein RL302_1287 [Pseudomonadota bacterium]
MQQPVAKPLANQEALYRSTVQEAAVAGQMLMGKLVVGARTNLQARESACRDLRERDKFADSNRQLRAREAELCKRYPQLLIQAFSQPQPSPKAAGRPAVELQFDQLELMDEAEVQSSVVMARLQQSVMLVAEASLTELNTLICGTLGLGAVQAERNPLRPESFIGALRDTVAQTGVPVATQMEWLGAMGSTLSTELKALYLRLCAQLLDQGVKPSGYAVTQKALGPGIGRGVAQEVRPGQAGGAAGSVSTGNAPAVRVHSKDEGLLTLDRLRRLLAGEMDANEPLNRVDQFAQQFARQFEGASTPEQPPVTDFDATVPAALEALQEMQQVERVVQTLEQRRKDGSGALQAHANAMDAQRQEIRRSAKNVAQALSLEVMTLMVDNMARDPRLLDPVHHVIKNLEPALLRLALADPRFFTDKQHPARLLLQELTHRSLAFDSVKSTGFEGFLKELEGAVAPLGNCEILDDEPFERVLLGLQEAWGRAARQKERAREQAVFALQHAEARNLLADKIARSVELHPDAARVPDPVIDFLCGPWAQVVAQARIKGGAGSSVAEKYEALISALLWSAHPELARQNVAKLTRLIPRLLGTLREGLDSIQYPSIRTSAFFESLMAIHQQAFRSQAAGESKADVAPVPTETVAGVRARFVEDGNPWIAPAEAESSNFVEITDADVPASTPADAPSADLQAVLSELPLGSWIELHSQGQWARTQLTWASPHGTLFLFTNSVGATQSMTRRSCDKLIAAGHLRLISGQPVVEEALDAVAQVAMRNSVDSTR